MLGSWGNPSEDCVNLEKEYCLQQRMMFDILPTPHSSLWPKIQQCDQAGNTASAPWSSCHIMQGTVISLELYLERGRTDLQKEACTTKQTLKDKVIFRYTPG